MNIYLAGPLFTEAERAWMAVLKRSILNLAEHTGVRVRVHWPYELTTDPEIIQLGSAAGPELFKRYMALLEEVDMVIALLDGPIVDDGTAWEIGYFYRMHRLNPRPIIGIRTDARSAGQFPNDHVNIMIEYSCDQIAKSQDEALTLLEGYLMRSNVLSQDKF